MIRAMAAGLSGLVVMGAGAIVCLTGPLVALPGGLLLVAAGAAAAVWAVGS